MKKSVKKSATIIALAAIAGASVNEMNAAARAAMADMKADLGEDAYGISYEWNPFDGLVA